MKPRYSWMIIALLFVAASGCRNYNPCWRPNPLAALGPCTITPPATGSYQVQATDPYYGGSTGAIPASGNSTVPVQPASSVSPGWRPAGSQVPAQPASLNQNTTSNSVPNQMQQIPMNNVVSSTQTSSLRPTSVASNVPANNQPRLNGNVNTGGMPVNDSTNLQMGTPGNWNQLANQNSPGSRVIAGGYEYSVQPTRSGPPVFNNQYNNPYNNQYGYPYNPTQMAQATAPAVYNAPANSGWQPQQTPSNFNR